MCQSQFILHCTLWLDFDFDFCLTFPWKYFYILQFCFVILEYKGMHYEYLIYYILKCYLHANTFFFCVFLLKMGILFLMLELIIFLNLKLLVSSCAYIDKFLDVFDIYSYLVLIHHVIIWIYSWWMIEFLNVYSVDFGNNLEICFNLCAYIDSRFISWFKLMNIYDELMINNIS